MPYDLSVVIYRGGVLPRKKCSKSEKVDFQVLDSTYAEFDAELKNGFLFGDSGSQGEAFKVGDIVLFYSNRPSDQACLTNIPRDQCRPVSLSMQPVLGRSVCWSKIIQFRDLKISRSLKTQIGDF